jgi:hypothetical protein
MDFTGQNAEALVVLALLCAVALCVDRIIAVIGG